MATRAWSSIASADAGLLAAIPAATLIVCGIALTAGLFTPFCSTVVALAHAVVLFLPFDMTLLLPRFDGGAAAVGLAATIALGLLGPGAFSVDARLFGRREIFIRAKDSAG